MDAESIFLIDRFVTTRTGEPYRLFPFGTIHKNGKTINLTPELAATFKLPHFKPAIKLGSHADTTPAGGHLIGLEVRGDGNCYLCQQMLCKEHGLFAIPEWNENGTTAVTSGAFRYHSPEIVSEGELLDSVTGNTISAPIIMGDALLHNPALGEAAAFYHVERNGGKTMSEMTQVPTSWVTRFDAWLDKVMSREDEPQPQPEPQTPPDVSKFEAELADKEAKLAEYKAEVEQMKAAANVAERIAHFGAELQEATAVSGDHELHTLLAGLPEDVAAKLVVKFKALSAQIDESGLTGDVGQTGEGQPLDQVAIVKMAEDYAKENKVNFTAAMKALATQKPEMFEGVLK